MRSADTFPENTRHIDHYWDSEGYQGSEPYSDAEEEFRDEESGNWTVHYFRIRPVPELFDTLAISIARAISCMPKLGYLDPEFSVAHRRPNDGDFYDHFKIYQGWASYFRSGNDAKSVSIYLKNEWWDPGTD